MKNFIQSIFLLLSFLVSNAQIVNIPDANFKNALVTNSNINTNGDDEIQVTEAEAYNLGIDVHNLNISDLTGIEAFTSIFSLDCSENNLNSLNITQNTALSILMCGTNQLTTIDLTQNTALTMFSCQTNEITSLDVSQNPNLNSFFCPNNQITSLDLTQNTALVSLNCMMNQLTTLDLRNGNNENIEEGGIYTDSNPNLTCIFVDDATYASENWPYIDAASTFVETEAACENLAIKSFEKNDLIVYPNPSKDILQIQMEITLKTASIFNLQGQKQLESSVKTINTTSLSAGYYIIKIENKLGGIAIKSFIKR